ncbi:hypothetical protein [Skermania sp. ID1734]|nr:hypothetical protein [Skermania sp. ID1734]
MSVEATFELAHIALCGDCRCLFDNLTGYDDCPNCGEGTHLADVEQ